MTRSSSWATLLTFAVTTGGTACGPRDDDTATHGGDPLSPYEMPYYGDCRREIAFDRSADGAVDYTRLWEFDTEERLVHYELDDVDGSFDHRAYTYDETGCYVGFEASNADSDGEVESSSAQQTCDDRGNLLTLNMVTIFGDPADPDDVWTVAYTYTNSYEGDLLVGRDIQISFEIESFGESSWTETELMTYERDLMVYRETWKDEELRDTETWSWDTDGHLLSYAQIDLAYDEDYLEEHGYDSHGREVAERQVSESAALLVGYTRTWDETAYRNAEVIKDEGEDGSPDATWTYDCEGAWPWSCTVSCEVEDAEAETHVDGDIDHSYTDSYICP